MRQLAMCLTVVLLATFLPGCPFDAKVPLGIPQRHDIDGRLTGNWVWDDPKGKGEATLVSVLPFNDSEYFVELTEGDKPPGRFRAFEVEVGDQRFWNVNEVGASFPPDSYAFVRCTLMVDGQLSLLFVGEKGVPKSLATDAPGLLAYLRSHMTDPSLNDDDGAYVWRRPKPGEIEKGRLRSGSAPPAKASGRSPRRR